MWLNVLILPVNIAESLERYLIIYANGNHSQGSNMILGTELVYALNAIMEFTTMLSLSTKFGQNWIGLHGSKQ